ncbi:Ferric siderophore transport system, biopolymer transport protein ExbB [hydrothermal vent metagenome]|uniref:Ferric siderophore transport system, biopolymer transport protein ExbB n=1 Tax=hydrothermal vent metagenome TaxID=652676 RepID=A0A3B0QVM0_9ZZZZ
METVAAFFKDGGIFVKFILVVSIIGFAIMVERAIFLLYKYNVDGKVLWKKVSGFIRDNDVEGAKAICSNNSVPLMKIMNYGLEASSGSAKDIQNAIDEAALEVIPSVDKRVTYLSTLANVATLLGLLGTIQGLIQAFSAIAVADPSQKAALLAKGISIALYSTASGLVVAIPMLIMYTILQAKSQKIIDEIDEFSVKLVNLLSRGKSGV